MCVERLGFESIPRGCVGRPVFESETRDCTY